MFEGVCCCLFSGVGVVFRPPKDAWPAETFWQRMTDKALSSVLPPEDAAEDFQESTLCNKVMLLTQGDKSESTAEIKGKLRTLCEAFNEHRGAAGVAKTVQSARVASLVAGLSAIVCAIPVGDAASLQIHGAGLAQLSSSSLGKARPLSKYTRSQVRLAFELAPLWIPTAFVGSHSGASSRAGRTLGWAYLGIGLQALSAHPNGRGIVDEARVQYNVQVGATQSATKVQELLATGEVDAPKFAEADRLLQMMDVPKEMLLSCVSKQVLATFMNSCLDLFYTLHWGDRDDARAANFKLALPTLMSLYTLHGVHEETSQYSQIYAELERAHGYLELYREFSGTPADEQQARAFLFYFSGYRKDSQTRTSNKRQHTCYMYRVHCICMSLYTHSQYRMASSTRLWSRWSALGRRQGSSSGTRMSSTPPSVMSARRSARRRPSPPRTKPGRSWRTSSSTAWRSNLGTSGACRGSS